MGISKKGFVMGKFWNITGLLCIVATLCLVILKVSSIITCNWWVAFLPLIIYGGSILFIIFIVVILTIFISNNS